MKIFRKNEIKILRNFFRNNNFLNKLIFQSYSEIDNFTGKKNINKKLKLDENKFPEIDENIANLLTEMEKDDSYLENSKNLNEYITQKDDIIFINNTDKVEILKQIKLGDLINLNKKYLAKCLAINNKIYTFVLFDRFK